jgi:O-antigen ligase
LSVRSLFRGQQGRVALATLILLAFCVFLGGSSRQHALRLSIVEIAALPLLAMAGLRLFDVGGLSAHRFALSIAAAAAAIPLFQLIPLPPWVWTALPGREQAVLALEVAGIAPGWTTVSLTPDATWRAFLALLPPLAVFVAALALDKAALRTTLWAVLALTAVSLVLAMAQVVSGGYDALYAWSIARRGEASGFFANRNHLATLCLLTLPLAAVLATGSARRGDEGRTAVWLGVLFMIVGVVALGVIRSRAGILLAGPVLGLSGLCAWVAMGRGRPGPALLAMAAGTGAAVTVVAAFGVAPILARFDTQRAELRFERWPTVAEAAQAHLPVGAGMGSFDPVYRSVEPLNELTATYFNQAHNEYLEIWLEAGWLGVAGVLAFLVWFGLRSWAAWRAGSGSEADLARAASAGILVVLVHSVAEFPLRTVTLTAVLALLCAILERSRIAGDARSGRQPSRELA